jgi:hypothetical protein
MPEKTATARSSRVGSVRAMISGVALRIGLSQVSRTPVRMPIAAPIAITLTESNLVPVQRGKAKSHRGDRPHQREISIARSRQPLRIAAVRVRQCRLTARTSACTIW